MGVHDAACATLRQELRFGMYRSIDVAREYAERALEAAQVRLRAIETVAEELKRRDSTSARKDP